MGTVFTDYNRIFSKETATKKLEFEIKKQRELMARLADIGARSGGRSADRSHLDVLLMQLEYVKSEPLPKPSSRRPMREGDVFRVVPDETLEFKAGRIVRVRDRRPLGIYAVGVCNAGGLRFVAESDGAELFIDHCSTGGR